LKPYLETKKKDARQAADLKHFVMTVLVASRSS